MGEVCFVTWIYGKKYIGYLPLYLYSIHKNYQDYGVKIFLENKLPTYIKEILVEFNLLKNTDIIEDFAMDLTSMCKSGIERRCIRWLIDSEYFGDTYKYLYFGDVDIYIVGENPALDAQHIDHINNSDNCYSNSLRLSVRDYFFSKDRNKISFKHLFRLTGLHFIEAERYFKRTKFAQSKIKKYLGMHRIKLIDYFLNDDERCLWLVIFLSGLKFPKGSYQLTDPLAFRPLHGVHFAIGREQEAYKSNFQTFPELKNEQYKYYKLFEQEYNSDRKLRMLIERLPIYTHLIIEKTCSFWGDVLGEDEIQTT